MTSRSEITSVAFSLFSPEQVRKLSVTEIREAKLDLNDRNNENLQSLYSRSMGPSQNHVRCPTCSLNTPDCTGHYAHIEFPRRKDGSKVYVLHEPSLPVILDLLRSVCNKCSTPLLSDKEIKDSFGRLKGAKRLKAIAKVSVKRDRCNCREGEATCYYANPVFVSKEKNNYIRYHAKDEKKLKEKEFPMMTPDTIRSIFRLITPEHCKLLGLAPGIRPENMILENLVVIPPSARPPRIIRDKVTHNDITNLYSDIVRTCRLIESGTLKQSKEDEAVTTLYTLISSLFNNSKGKYHYTNGKAHRTFKEIITGKGRLIRGYTQGKRVAFCIRSVASPDPTLRINQVRVPRNLARKVTHPEWVDATNIDRLQSYVDRGFVNYITPGSGPHKGRVFITKGLKDEDRKLRIGDQVDRWLMGARVENGVKIPGDVVLVNRQPTLHKMSMMGFEVVISDEQTIGMSTNVCAPFGLDFDGDELMWNVGLEQAAAGC